MKPVRRPPTVDGMDIDDFIRANADPTFLHQEELWEYLELEDDMDARRRLRPRITSGERELVSFITVEDDDDLIVAYALALEEAGDIASLILQHAPRYEMLLPREERGVSVSHELHPGEDRLLAQRIVVAGPHVDIDTTGRAYRLDLSEVDAEEAGEAQRILRRMHRYGGFTLECR
jgi:hypothetical protein